MNVLGRWSVVGVMAALIAGGASPAFADPTQWWQWQITDTTLPSLVWTGDHYTVTGKVSAARGTPDPAMPFRTAVFVLENKDDPSAEGQMFTGKVDSDGRFTISFRMGRPHPDAYGRQGRVGWYVFVRADDVLAKPSGSVPMALTRLAVTTIRYKAAPSLTNVKYVPRGQGSSTVVGDLLVQQQDPDGAWEPMPNPSTDIQVQDKGTRQWRTIGSNYPPAGRSTVLMYAPERSVGGRIRVIAKESATTFQSPWFPSASFPIKAVFTPRLTGAYPRLRPHTKSTYVLSGRMRRISLDGRALRNPGRQKLSIQIRVPGKGWKTLTAVTTRADGRFTLTTKVPLKATRWRIIKPADATFTYAKTPALPFPGR
ncbi:hypothetical protein GCM10027589_17260 [Actinocorallia lasiicapitis]